MLWWFKNRGCWWVLGTTAIATVVLVLTEDADLTIPSLLGLQSLVQPVGFFAPIPVVVACSAALARTDSRLEAGTTRHVRLADLGLALATIGTVLVAHLIAPAPVVLLAARNLTTALGITLVAAQLVPRDLAAVPVVLWILAGALTGRSYGHDALWNWPVMDAGDLHGVVWAGAAAALGCLAHCALPPRPTAA